MKKTVWLLVLVVMAFAGCNDDEEEVAQLSFSYPNMATLIGKSGSYIKQASPGAFYKYVEYVDYSYYTYIFDEITVLGSLALNYQILEDECDDILMFTASEELDKAKELMLIATNELGEAGMYFLDYIYDSTVYEITFTTYSSLWAHITDNSYTVDDIFQIYSVYLYDDYTTYAGGFWDEGEFWPFAEIAAVNKKSTDVRPHFHNWKGKLKRSF